MPVYGKITTGDMKAHISINNKKQINKIMVNKKDLALLHAKTSSWQKLKRVLKAFYYYILQCITEKPFSRDEGSVWRWHQRSMAHPLQALRPVPVSLPAALGLPRAAGGLPLQPQRGAARERQRSIITRELLPFTQSLIRVSRLSLCSHAAESCHLQ